MCLHQQLEIEVDYSNPSECQKHDWRHGSPRPHRDICGNKDLKEAPKATLQQANDERFPQPENGFRRSPALLHQISLLKRLQGNPDYVVGSKVSCVDSSLIATFKLINPRPHDDWGIRVPNRE